MTPRKTTAKTTQSWDDFWAEQSTGRTETIRGIEVKVPTDMPIALEKRVDELRDSEEQEDLNELVAMLFGDDVLEAWEEAGMGLVEFQTVLTWGMGQAAGKDLTFGEALDLVREGDGEGKRLGPAKPNRANRRAASKPRSKSTGGRSKPTSKGSTASTRKASRA